MEFEITRYNKTNLQKCALKKKHVPSLLHQDHSCILDFMDSHNHLYNSSLQTKWTKYGSVCQLQVIKIF